MRVRIEYRPKWYVHLSCRFKCAVPEWTKWEDYFNSTKIFVWRTLPQTGSSSSISFFWNNKENYTLRTQNMAPSITLWSFAYIWHSNRPTHYIQRIVLKYSQSDPRFDYFCLYLCSPPSPMPRQPLVGQGLLIIKASRWHTDKPHSVGFLWMRNRPVAETSTWQNITLARGDSKPHSQQASGRTTEP
jgi:hypothetical protein